MALDYNASAALMMDAEFRGRVKVACLKFADYISNESANVPAHSTRLRWASATMTSPDSAAGQVTPVVVMDAAVQQDGDAITDPALQGAVENAVNKML